MVPDYSRSTVGTNVYSGIDMHGTITEFDPLRGCGVIYCDDLKVDVSWCMVHAKDETRLQIGDVVNFTGCGGPNGPEAREIILLWRSEKKSANSSTQRFKAATTNQKRPTNTTATHVRSTQSEAAIPMPRQPQKGLFVMQADDRDQCIHCGKLMTPTLALVDGSPHRSFCPYCGEVRRDFTKPYSPTIKERAADAAVGGVIGVIVSGLFGL